MFTHMKRICYSGIGGAKLLKDCVGQLLHISYYVVITLHLLLDNITNNV